MTTTNDKHRYLKVRCKKCQQFFIVDKELLCTESKPVALGDSVLIITCPHCGERQKIKVNCEEQL